ncbi:hypothetical protein BIV57_00260 [Mangrovactinospora gilvigrisea]|uniref:Shikimate kinase n=1 Tax=Mangrovactinospora gilvigrisea TaxID=1428644 RepID=A0A1J7BKV9_9ACTN|nr:hypothetical protein [Mangrovactinospora gilvigrisea]OIV39319.1 hypothetical protein BIV57_00260 [Mangrovactinospora gilvigrisea]
MSLIYVTGLSGTGKSAVLKELRARGFCARGVDEDAFADWISRATGERAELDRDDPDLDRHVWFAAHDWVLSVERITALHAEAQRLGEPVFLCGVAAGDDKVWHLFAKVVALVADAPTVTARLAARGEGYGSSPEELAAILGWHTTFEANYRRFGATIVDAVQPLGRVVDQVIAEASS